MTQYLNAPLYLPSGVPDFSSSSRRSGSPTFEAQAPFTSSCARDNNNSNSVSEADFLVDEDDTSYCLTIEMPGVRGKDISVSVDSGMLTVSGYRRLGVSNKKQRLQRRFPVNTSVVDVSRAVATIWNDALVLYAPKRTSTFHQSMTTMMTIDEPELEFCSPGAERLLAQETSTVCEWTNTQTNKQTTSMDFESIILSLCGWTILPFSFWNNQPTNKQTNKSITIFSKTLRQAANE
jgi:HSP20 family molecular chaperone IbpA